MLNKLANYVGWVMLAAALAVATFYSATSITPKATASNPNTPSYSASTYFITQEEAVHRPDSSIFVDQGKQGAWERVYGRRADGATVNIYWIKDAPQNAIRSVTFPAKGIIVSVNGLNDYKSTFGSGKPMRIPHRESTCGIKNLVGEDTIQGFKALHAFMEDATGTKTDRWYAPALDCMEVKTLARDVGGTFTTIEPLVLSDKAPPDSYFAIRDGLKELDPIAFRRSMSDKPKKPSDREVEVQMGAYNSAKAIREGKDTSK